MRLDSWNLLRCLWSHALTCSDHVSSFPMTWTCRQHCCIVGRCQLRYCTANQNYFSSAKSSRHSLDSSWYHQSECLKILFSCYKGSLSTLSTNTSQKKTLKKILQRVRFILCWPHRGEKIWWCKLFLPCAHLKIWDTRVLHRDPMRFQLGQCMLHRWWPLDAFRSALGGFDVARAVEERKRKCLRLVL